MLSDVLKPIATRRRPSQRRHVLSQGIKQSLTALIAFVVAAGLLNQIIPSPMIPANVVFVSPKYAYYQAQKDKYNTLFFGSSRVYNQISPEAFDASAGAAGLAVKSYNFGVPAMRALDSTVLLEAVLRDPPENLKWVFFETILDKGYEPIPNARTQRAMYWHTWENTQLAARYIATSEVSAANKAVLMTSHFLPALYHQLNVGRLFNQVLPSEFSAEEQATAERFTAAQGFAPLIDESSPKRQAFLNDQAGYASGVDRLVQTVADGLAPEATLAANKTMLLARITAAIQAAGAEPIFIEPPSLDLDRDFRVAQQQGEIETLLAYKDPQKFPQLYGPEHRFDADHLNEAASIEFSKLMAQDFAQAVQSNP
ncbi:MAG: hypothetical protein AAFO84_02700 [Cyanobacteria bacterium J06598_1]